MANITNETQTPVTGATAPTTRRLVVEVAHLEDLFNAPDVNPLTDRDLRAIGEPALVRAIRELQAAGVRDERPVALHIQLPTEQIATVGGAQAVSRAIRRYCAAKIADNAETVHVTRRRARRGMEVAATLVLIFAALAYVLLTTVFAQAGTVVQAIVVGSLSVFTWVVLWDTLEAWIFDPIPPSFENRALTKLRQAEIIVESPSSAPEPQ
jgi:hypothetical protein